MEIFCRNIPPQVQDKHLDKEIRPILEKYGLGTFKCRKVGPKNAIVTVLDKSKALRLLAVHGQQPGQKKKPPQPLRIFGQIIFLEPGRHQPEELLLRSLQHKKENGEASLVSKSQYAPEPPLTKDVRSLPIRGMSCGVWAYENDTPIFVECYSWGDTGFLTFRKTSIKAELYKKHSGDVFTVDFSYSNLISLFTGTRSASVSITTYTPPKLYRQTDLDRILAMQAMMDSRPGPIRARVGRFLGDIEGTSGCCFTYRFVLLDPSRLRQVKILARKFHAPDVYRWVDSVGRLPHSLQSHMQMFSARLRVENIPYRVKFQLQLLIWNGYISPLQAVGFLVHVKGVLRRTDGDTVAKALHKMQGKLPLPSPDVPAWQVELRTVESTFSDEIKSANREKNSGINSQRIHPNMVEIHHASVTPCGIWLSGPKMETKNRVLRKYSDYIDNFLRVTFTDEDGGPVRYDSKARTDEIFHDRFKSLLKAGIEIGGRLFEYLGFSHSSLRSQTCWFVAPFTTNDRRTWDSASIIRDLGVFTNIKSPSKMAARIGQAFSDTVTSIEIPPENVFRMRDVERNGRCFSDGVGTISVTTAQKIWGHHATKATPKPTVFQIRYSGAKGMVSVDSRIQGDGLFLRNSMIKFQGTSSALEICGSGSRALPFYLNQQLVKILEDLGVPPSSFLALQRAEVKRLRETPGSATQAAEFLEGTQIPRSLNFPWLIRILQSPVFNISFNEDIFLRSLVKLAILIRLRDIKYKARIPVPKAVTLYGVMDETGILREGEIFCPMATEDGRRQVLVRNSVVITRSPALHPGDIQIVNAVDVPSGHPLRKLHNCVVFSQRGQRDLPSMLSGGDLDGDLYNVIYDETLTPEAIYMPAEYPRVEERILDRPVQREDIIDFFVTFMQQDQLGRIATSHQVLADQRPDGTLDPDCLLLAELHSTAVDFSKSGTPVDLRRMPKIRPFRPDFMAPGPRVRIAEDISLFQDESNALVEIEDADDDEPRPTQYYKSKKILGQLYREIDEEQFFQEIQRAFEPSNLNTDVLGKVWEYVEQQVVGFEWKHMVEKAEGIKEVYESEIYRLRSEYSDTPWRGSSITEYEVVLGTILGQGRKQSRANKESSKSLRDEFEDLADLVNTMISDSEAAHSQSLELSIACFHVALRDHQNYVKFARRVNFQNHGSSGVFSFPWVTAAACLKEVMKFQQDNYPIFIS